MVRCVEALEIDEGSTILEIGFGCGYSADRIQGKRPRTHTIVECSAPVLAKLREWAKTRPNVVVVERCPLLRASVVRDAVRWIRENAVRLLPTHRARYVVRVGTVSA